MKQRTPRPRLSASPRPRDLRKSELRQLRRSGGVPALIYGHGEPETLQVSRRELDQFLRRHPPGALLELVLQSGLATAVIRELERDPVTGEVIHLGFQRVDLGETIRQSIPVRFTGEERLIRRSLVLQRQMEELEVSGRADLLPESIPVDVGDAAPGTTLRVRDLPLPEGLVPVRDLELPVATISVPAVPPEVEAVLDAELAEEAEETGAEVGAGRS